MKRKEIIPASMACAFNAHDMWRLMMSVSLLGSSEKEGCRGFQLCIPAKRKRIPGTAGSCSTLRPKGEKLKNQRLFHFT